VLQVAVRAGIHRDGANAELLARAQNAQRDLAAVGNDDFFKHGRSRSFYLFASAKADVCDQWANGLRELRILFPGKARVAERAERIRKYVTEPRLRSNDEEKGISGS